METFTGGRVIITAALTGALTTRKQCEHIPYTPVEIAEEAARCADAGAAVVHIHAREDDGLPSFSVEKYRQIMDEIRKRSDVIINFSTGAVGIPMEDRVGHIHRLRPEIGALNMGSMNYAIYSKRSKTFYFDFVFSNPFKDISFLLEKMNDAGVKPELEVFDNGHIGNTRPLLDQGILKTPLDFSLVMGVLGGIPSTTKALLFQAESLPSGSTWKLVGISKDQWPLLTATLTLGGNVRVGLEDNFYLPDGEMAKGSSYLVEKAAAMCADVGRPVASIAEAREALGLSPAPCQVPSDYVPAEQEPVRPDFGALTAN
ncbi:MAG: 3-keto-5-aminohexanoate cleavage enzyme [Chloroflexota bacterium]|nr:3-keto-5-aminohexanoate cleavage enzyme [Chloroflexota bacterium]